MNSLEKALAAQDKALAAFRAPASEQGPPLPTEEQAKAYAVEMARRWLAICDRGMKSVEGKFMAEALIAYWGPEVADRAGERVKVNGAAQREEVRRDLQRQVYVGGAAA